MRSWSQMVLAFVVGLPLASPAIAAAQAQWVQLDPPIQSSFKSFYDPLRNNLVILAGGDPSDLSIISLDDMTGVRRNPTAPANFPASVIIDVTNDRLLAYGGPAPIPNDTVWTLDLSQNEAWVPFVPAGTPPASRVHGAIVHDTLRDRIVLMGGYGYWATDVWELTLSGTPTWNQLAPTGTSPLPRWGFTPVYDAIDDCIILHSGSFFSDEIYTIDISPETWQLDLSMTPPRWTRIAISTNQLAEYTNTSIFDPTRHQFVTISFRFGMLNLTGTPAWQVLGPTQFPLSTICFDPVGDRILGYSGGFVWSLPMSTPNAWELEGPWGPPFGLMFHTAIRDPAAGDMVLFGGVPYRYTNPPTNEVYAYSMIGSRKPWRRLQPAFPLPPGRVGHAATYDALRHRMIVFGGQDHTQRFNDVWALSLGDSLEWTPLSIAGTPPSQRSFASILYDAPRDRVILFGGATCCPLNDWFDLVNDGQPCCPLGDTWELSLSGTPTWTQLSPGGDTPPLMDRHKGIYDPVNDRMVVLGDPGTWALDLSGATSWCELPTTGITPIPRRNHSLVYDELSHRMLVFNSSAVRVWELPFNTLEWAFVANEGTTLTGIGTAAVFDAAQNRMIAHGGGLSGGIAEVYALYFGNLPVEAPWSAAPAVGLAIQSVRPNPSSEALQVRFVVRATAPVRVELLDVSGRRIEAHPVRVLAPGAHQVRLGDRARLAPGLYLVRVTQGTQSVTAKAAVLR